MELKHLKLFAIIISFNLVQGSTPFDDGVDPDSSLPLPPLENEWEWNPNIFAAFPKPDMTATRKITKLDDETPGQDYLPGTTRPTEYAIWLRIILDSENPEEEHTAPGKVRITIKCVEATKEIVLHAKTKYLTILEDTVKLTENLHTTHDGKEIPITNHTYDEKNDFYKIHLEHECLVQKEYHLDIEFITQIATDALTGLYLSAYTDPVENITKKLATTQFEAEFARNMFPNYDDPDYKAIFRIVLGRHKDYNSLSNMNIVKTEAHEELPDWYWDHYAPTPKMSSYLIAVIVSDFTCVSPPEPGYVKLVEICGPSYMIERGGGDHSAQAVATILEFYDKFMKQPYPLPKMTSVAIPDFQAGAMENWGLNTYRIKGLILYPGETSEEGRLRIDLTIAHELAHQNFGNLVTNKFWNQIWLNEGFATYISYYGLKSFSPDFDPDNQWLSYRKRALVTDANLNTHPLVNVSNQMYYFDGISYSKGASLLRMMERFLTEDIFHEGLQSYLTKHAYGTATQWDLFDIIDSHAFASGFHPGIGTVSEIMETWSLQKGYPLIKVEYITNRVIAISQERFIDTIQVPPSDDENSEGPPSGFPTLWYLPIFLQIDGAPNSVKQTPYTWLTNNELTKVIYLDEKFETIIVNPDGSAFARVLYDDKTAEIVAKHLETSHHLMSPVTRAVVIEDAFETAWAGYGPVEVALKFTRYLHHETEPIAWSAALNGLGRIYSMLVDDVEGVALFKNYVFNKIESVIVDTRLHTLANETGIKVIHLGQILNWAGMLEIPVALQHANDLVQDWAESAVNKIPPDLHAQTYCNALIGGDQNLHDTVLTFLQQETDEDILQAVARGLGCSRNKEFLHDLRKNITTQTTSIDPYVHVEILIKLVRNSITRESLIEYLDESFDDLKQNFGIGIFIRNLEAATQYWNTKEKLAQVEEFIEKYKENFGKVAKRLARIRDQIQKNILWMERHSDSIKTWLRSNQ